MELLSMRNRYWEGTTISSERSETLLSMSVPATLHGVRVLCLALVGVLREQCEDQQYIDQFESAVAEAANNIVQHGMGVCELARIDVEVIAEGEAVAVSLRDYGPHFDPVAYLEADDDPQVDIHAATESHARVGLKLIRRLVDELEYHRLPNGNQLILRKYLSVPS